MYECFTAKGPKRCSYDVYRREVKEMNISFVKLGHEECEICEEMSLHNPEHKKDALKDDCDMCLKWKSHIEQAEAARQEYGTDRDAAIDDDSIIFSADLEKVIMLPRMDTFKTALFTRRIIAFNESFVPLGASRKYKPLAVIWHEAIAGRKKEDITSAFCAFLMKYRDIKTITIWLDICTGQNKNWSLFCFLVFRVNSSQTGSDSITLKYLEPGHTFMSADSFHHQVERSLTQKKKVYDFNDFSSAVESANSGFVDVKRMEAGDFRDKADQSSTFKINKATPRPYLRDMSVVKFERGSTSMAYKTDFTSASFRELKFLTAKATKGMTMPPARVNARGIPQEKKDDILSKLVPLMPPNRKAFWADIPVANVPDLVSVAE